ncbi:thioredoxin-like protein 1 [Elsinoe australis]|uniref:Thioredoxin-like protein 1 n=1 Tax=Elsinoe australis TaxID=40998 RepID=A0A4U7BCV2_9PEZI|nr:thioredoxin-like protein 1 [Elsinoe australis]
MDDMIAQFTSITGATPERAQQYLNVSDNNVEQAVTLFFETGGADMGGALPEQQVSQPAASGRGYRENADGTVTIDSDDDEVMTTGSRPAQPSTNYEDDEAMARRLQEEAYGSGGVGGGMDEVRAPMARTTETLVGPDADWGGPDDMRAAIAEQMAARQGRRTQARPGIFNQQHVSVWDEDDPDAARRSMARATGGASEASSKSNLLAELFRPPVDLMSTLSWDDAREEGKEEEKWILVNIQDPSIFDCQVLNRDIWKNASIKDTVRENFIFMQYSKDDPRGGQYINYYFQARDNEDAYPHIAIVDPRTGEQVKVWSGSPAPKPSDFLMDLHEFLDRYSLKAFAKNPVATRKPEKKTKDVAKMSEEEMLEMALQNSLQNGGGPSHKEEDPDDYTKVSKGKEPVPPLEQDVEMNRNTEEEERTPFSLIPSDRPHEEPTDPASTTRIQFRWSGGRVVRRFALTDTVQRLYEWLKASPLEGKEGVDFELISMGKNLIESLDQTVEQAGLKNASVMVEFLEG